MRPSFHSEHDEDSATSGQLKLFRQLLEHFPETIYCAHVSPQREVVFISGGVEALTGYPPDHFIGSSAAPLQDFIHPDDRERVRQIVGEAVDKNASFKCEYRIITADNVVKWVWEHGAALQATEQTGCMLLEGLMIDVTSIKQRQQTAREYQHLHNRLDALQKEDSLHRVMGSVAHLFNNKLHAALGFLEMAELEQRNLHRFDVIRSLQPIQASLMEAARISSRMLACAGEIHNAKEIVDLASFCNALHDELKRSEPPQIDFSWKCNVSAAAVIGDPNGLREMIKAMVFNAFESSGVKNVMLHLDYAQNLVCSKDVICLPEDWKSQHQTSVCISVRDDGEGMSPTMMHQIFDPFFSTKFVGRGIGLTVALEQARSHDGCMCVHSTEDVETCFSVCLPVLPSSDALEDAVQDVDVESRVKTKPCASILVVDDEQPLRQMAAIQVRSLGYIPLLASNMSEALELLKRHAGEIVAVISDIRMPGKSGWELLMRIRQNHADLPVILMSAYEKPTASPSPEHPLPNGFLRKPYLTAELRALLSQFVGESV